jgi:FkbM family methyltransferase
MAVPMRDHASMELRQVRHALNPRRVVKAIKLRLRPKPESRHFLINLRGVIHVGAHAGQERHKYARYALEVLWIEANPSVVPQLKQNLRDFPKQRALQALITDTDGTPHTFHIYSGASSILELAQVTDIWPQVKYVDHIELSGVTLPTLLKREGIDLRRYNGLILDTQGTELSIMKGAEAILPQFKYIKTEVADFEAYKGGALLHDVQRYLQTQGFTEIGRLPFAVRPGGGTYYDVVFKRVSQKMSRKAPAGL